MVDDARRTPARRLLLSGDTFAAQVYGLLVVGAALAVARPGAQSRWSVFADVVVLALVYSLAHVYADLLHARSNNPGRIPRTELHSIVWNGVAILRGTALPFVAFALCELFRVRDATSVNVALWVLVGELAVVSWLASDGVEPASRRVAYASGAALLGVVLIALKVVTH